MDDMLGKSREYLIKKYNIDLYNYGSYMYNEYPHKSIWSKEFNKDDYRRALKSLFLNQEDNPRLLFIHIPFCRQRCFFCLCHSFIIKDYGIVKNYLNFLFQEIDLLRKFCDDNLITPDFQRIHIGGGSPTILAEEEFDQLIERIQTITDIRNIEEFSIEIDPRNTSKEKIKYYQAKGINRISFGIQDFNFDVQKAVNRVQPLELIKNLLVPDIRKGLSSVNFDILCGLPRQTRESFRETIDTVIKLSPERIMLMFFIYAPDTKVHQKLIKKSEIPDVNERIVFFHDAIEALLANGYVRIGVDHFAKPTDSLAKAMIDENIHWNSLGYGVGKQLDMLGLGPNSSSNPYS